MTGTKNRITWKSSLSEWEKTGIKIKIIGITEKTDKDWKRRLMQMWCDEGRGREGKID